MTHATKPAPRLAALPAAAVAALLLAGCSSGHVGESWQCPLAEGGRCDSVAAADPAVPHPDAARGTAIAEPLWRVGQSGRSGAPVSAAPCETACGGGFDPIAWLAGLFAAKSDEGDARPAGRSAEAPAAPAGHPPEPVLGEETAAVAAEPGPSREEPAPDGAASAGLRTGEVVARIWIAPFVDADGVYREASHVRVVLEPAGWRLR